MNAADPLASQYSAKADGYFSAARHDLLALLPRNGGLRILEIGAGSGATLRAAKAGGWASHVVGIDIAAPPAGSLEGLDGFLVGNVESMHLDLGPAAFDAVICGDVLEHLIDPWTAVRKVGHFLAPGGLFVASIPNIRNHRALREIVLRGDFGYQEAGLLDRSHLRFFCRRNAIALFEQAGLTVERVDENMGGYGLINRAVDLLTGGWLHDFFVFQFKLAARKS